MYCKIKDILNNIERGELISLVNDENRSSVDLSDNADPCVIRIQEAISQADEEINGYLRSRYTLPFQTVPESVYFISIDIAIYRLYQRRHRLDMPESLTSIYHDRKRELEKIQRGEILLYIQEEPSVPASAVDILTNKTPEDKIFSKTTLDMF